MEERIQKELEFLQTRFNIECVEEGRWVRVLSYPLPIGWNRSVSDIAFQVPVGYPGTPPYGIYVPIGIAFNGQRPNNYQEPAPTQPPFGGSWGIFSWQPDGEWRVTTEIVSGANLMNWVMGFATRFQEGL